MPASPRVTYATSGPHVTTAAEQWRHELKELGRRRDEWAEEFTRRRPTATGEPRLLAASRSGHLVAISASPDEPIPDGMRPVDQGLRALDGGPGYGWEPDSSDAGRQMRREWDALSAESLSEYVSRYLGMPRSVFTADGTYSDSVPDVVHDGDTVTASWDPRVTARDVWRAFATVGHPARWELVPEGGE